MQSALGCAASNLCCILANADSKNGYSMHVNCDCQAETRPKTGQPYSSHMARLQCQLDSHSGQNSD